jgi:16S rRNA (cytidine1402-2'-O)-methyltransferase
MTSFTTGSPSGGRSSADQGERPSGVLYLVATPIGNLEDITLRALRTLREVDVIAAEDTRVTLKLLSHYGISKPLVSYHRHSKPGALQRILSLLREGKNVALVCDAGTPGISDPGEEVVRACVREGLQVAAIPGPSALISALSVAGLPTSGFVFTGFLPRRASERRRAIAELAGERRTLVFFEAPHRLLACLKDMIQALGDRQAVAARELTKKFEEMIRGPLSSISKHFEATKPRGEIIIIVAGAQQHTPRSEESPGDRMSEAIAMARSLRASGKSTRSAAMQAGETLNVRWRAIYRALLSG